MTGIPALANALRLQYQPHGSLLCRIPGLRIERLQLSTTGTCVATAGCKMELIWYKSLAKW